MAHDHEADQETLRSLETPELWAAYMNTQSRAARDELAARYVWLVQRLAGGLVDATGMDERHLMVHGLMGLISAIERFDPASGLEFAVYATDRIRHSMVDEFVALEKAHPGVAFQAQAIAQVSADLEARLGRAATDAEVAEALGHAVASYQESLKAISDSTIAELERIWALPASEASGRVRTELGSERTPDSQLLTQASALNDQLADAIASLPEREKLVIALHYYESLSLDEIAEMLGVTASRVAQLHTKAVLRLKSRLQTTPPRSRPPADTGEVIRTPGRLRGRIILSPDFDRTPPDLLEAFEGDGEPAA